MEYKLLLRELKTATFDYKSFFKTIGKDSLFLFIIFILFMIYSLSLLSIYPQKPWWAEGDKIFDASQFEITTSTNELKIFLLVYILSTILIILLILILFTLFREWVWKDLTKNKYSISSFFKFLGLNTISLLLITLFFMIIVLPSGLLIQFLANNGVALPPIMFIALITLFPLLFIVLHFLNYSGFEFIKTKKFGRTLIETFKSFKHVKLLLIPYFIITLLFIILGTIVNNIFLIKDPILNIIGVIIFLSFLAWEKVYSSYFFKRIYG